MRLLHTPLCMMCLSVATLGESAETMHSSIAVVPIPVEAKLSGDEPFRLSTETVIAMDGDDTSGTGELLAKQIRAATGYAVPVVTGRRDEATSSQILLSSKRADPSLGPEGYQLEVTSRTATIRAPFPAGLFYGTQTLRQLLPPEIESESEVSGVDWVIPSISIRDMPRFPYRGFMLDSSRHIQSPEFIYRTLDLMAYHKLNVFHWHLTDDAGWRLEIRKYPRLTEVGAWRHKDGERYGGFFTQDQVRDLIAYAAQRNITIIPEIEMPAHSTAALASYPENACTSGPFTVKNIGEPSLDVFCPGKEDTFRFLEGVLDEVVALFPSTLIHIGGDECNKTRWKACPDCQAVMKRENLQDEDALQSWFTHRIAAYLRSKGRRLQGWDEILHGGNLPKDVVVHQWDQPKAAVQAARAGNDVVVSSTGWTYFDYDYKRIPLQKVYESDPVPPELSASEATRILGQQAQLWTEYRPTDASADEYIWPRLIALAERSWSPRETGNWQEFMNRMRNVHYKRLALRGLGAIGTGAETILENLLNPRTSK